MKAKINGIEVEGSVSEMKELLSLQKKESTPVVKKAKHVNTTYRPWSKEESVKLIELYRKKYTGKTISELLNRSVSAVQQRMSDIRHGRIKVEL